MKAVVMFLLSVAGLTVAIPREQFYSFGENAGDLAVGRNDDGSSGQVTLRFGSFPYFEQQHTTLYVSDSHISIL